MPAPAGRHLCRTPGRGAGSVRHNESDRREVGMARHPLIGYLVWLVLFGALFTW